jgi:hypothetical protein
MNDVWIALALLLVVSGLELWTRGAITRRVLREIARFFILMELGAMRLMRLLMPPKFVLLGQCYKSGACCKQLLADPPSFIKRTWLVRLFVAYHRVMHNFEPVALGPDDEIIFSCRHLQSDNRCAIYRFRPLLCRNYPVLPFFDPPRPLPGCGFRVAPRVVAKMKKRPSLRIVNPVTAVHHPSPAVPSDEPLPEHFELVDDSWQTPPREEKHR